MCCAIRLFRVWRGSSSAVETKKSVIEAAHAVLNQLQHSPVGVISNRDTVEILGPAPAPLSKIEGKFRWHFLLRSETAEAISQRVQQLTAEPPAAIKSNAVELMIDIDATSVL